ncbi:MAG: type II toxin-antitoxin system VapC family toxin [Gammaproteobacteria bacterium]|jgi:predicted nucleic acid-binding protein|nr:type II toxin-antitoxin system VapC family toxin [Gammaproteobacteria bacterium]
MNAVVIDASALAAVLFDEPEAAPILASVRGRLIAPGLIRYELASVSLSKLMRKPERAADIDARHALIDALDLTLFEPDWPELPRLARRWALSVYDAAYLQLALARRVPLVTLDARLAAAYDGAVGGR